MAAIETHHLFNRPISDHCFSSDQQTLIVGKDTEAEIYGRSGSDFTLQDTLRGHDKLITGVDIAPSTGRIVTCSQGKPSHWPSTIAKASRSKRLCMGEEFQWLEANLGTAPDQSGGYLCQMVTDWNQVCCGFRGSRGSCMLFRARE